MYLLTHDTVAKHCDSPVQNQIKPKTCASQSQVVHVHEYFPCFDSNIDLASRFQLEHQHLPLPSALFDPFNEVKKSQLHFAKTD